MAKKICTEEFFFKASITTGNCWFIHVILLTLFFSWGIWAFILEKQKRAGRGAGGAEERGVEGVAAGAGPQGYQARPHGLHVLDPLRAVDQPIFQKQ